MLSSIIPIIASIWLFVKAAVELRKTVKEYNSNIFVDDNVQHANHHLGALIGFVGFAFLIPIQIVVGKFVFSTEWIPTFLFIDSIILYVVEHFRKERLGDIRPIRFWDIINCHIFDTKGKKNK